MLSDIFGKDRPLHKQVVFQQWTCYVHKTTYSSGGRIALYLTDKDSGSKVAMCTINAVNESLATKEIIVKDYSENEGMYKALLQAGIISPAKRYISSGFVQAPVCDCLI